MEGVQEGIVEMAVDSDFESQENEGKILLDESVKSIEEAKEEESVCEQNDQIVTKMDINEHIEEVEE